MKFIAAGRASLIVAMNPVFISLLAVLFFKDRLNWVRGTGILLSVFGAMIVISKGNFNTLVSDGLGRGELLILGGVASWAAFSIIGKILVKGLSPLVSVSYSSLIGAAALFLPACFGGMLEEMFSYSLVDWTSIFFLGVFGTVLGFVWYYEGIRRSDRQGRTVHQFRAHQRRSSCLLNPRRTDHLVPPDRRPLRPIRGLSHQYEILKPAHRSRSSWDDLIFDTQAKSRIVRIRKGSF